MYNGNEDNPDSCSVIFWLPVEFMPVDTSGGSQRTDMLETRIIRTIKK
jgi:hypothetical protein